MSKERPILFNAPMVCAILAGTKTQTRRIVKPQPPLGHSLAGFTMSSTCRADEGTTVWSKGEASPMLADPHRVRCPFGRPDDRLWVRETFCEFIGHHAETGKWAYGADVKCSDGERVRQDYIKAGYPYQWKPSIHMPRAASRITLEVTGVRVERLTSISETDAKAEGLTARSKDGTLVKYGIPDRDGLPGNDDHGWHWQEWESDPRRAYRTLWESINGPGSWDANPWVWVVEFKRVEVPHA